VVRAAIILVLLSLSAFRPVAAQTEHDTVPGKCQHMLQLRSSLQSDTRRSLWRALSVTSLPRESGLVRGHSIGAISCIDSAPWLLAWHMQPVDSTLKFVSPETSVTINAQYPRSINDGSAWRGVGLNFAISGGARSKWRALTVNVEPELSYATNGSFPLVRSTRDDRSSFANSYHPGIDYPTRPGADPLLILGLGQTYASAPAGPLSVTVSTENLWVGAADVYPIILSYTAPGFPHMRVSSREPIDLRIADLEFHLVYGSLRESEFFDSVSANDRHFFATTVAVLKPRVLPGLSIGVARAYHDSATITWRLLQIPFAKVSSERAVNVIDAVLARWVLPASGFEIYGEYSRERGDGFAQAVLNPERSQGYVVGFQKVSVRPARLVRFYGELTHLGESPAARAGEFQSYYTDDRVAQGHTHKGQLLGAAIGPGSDAQLLGVDVYSARSRTGLRLERTRYDDDAYYRTWARLYGEGGHDAEVSLSVNRTQMVNQVEVEAGLAFRHRHNPYFTIGPNQERNNLSMNLRVAW
jgi:hypothetical protein